MVSKAQIENGLVKQVDAEILPKTTGLQYWAMAAAATLAATKADAVIDSLLSQPMIQTLGVVSNGSVDLDAIYKAVRPAAERTPANITVPYVGTFTLNADDVDKIYNYILQS